MNKNLKSGFDEYQRKLKSGEIEKPIAKDPIQKAKEHPKSLRLAIKAKCWECSCFTRVEVTHCTAKDCPLWFQRPWQVKDSSPDPDRVTLSPSR